MRNPFECSSQPQQNELGMCQSRIDFQHFSQSNSLTDITQPDAFLTHINTLPLPFDSTTTPQTFLLSRLPPTLRRFSDILVLIANPTTHGPIMHSNTQLRLHLLVN